MTEKKEKKHTTIQISTALAKKCAGGIELSSISRYITYKFGEMLKPSFLLLRTL